jgi:hypothetical protein
MIINLAAGQLQRFIRIALMDHFTAVPEPTSHFKIMVFPEDMTNVIEKWLVL